jgi:HPt (histidine-containing phosphotransfer) domain-containing protein
VHGGGANMAVRRGHVKMLDREKLLEDCDDEASFANHCLQIFVKETQADIDSIALALGKSDLAQVARLAHRIKGASATIRARFLLEEAARLQVLGDEERGDEAALSFARLRADFENFRRFIVTLPPLPD